MVTTPANAIGVTTPGAVSFNGSTFTGSTLPVGYGGTDATTFSVNGAVFSNTTTTGALQAATLTDGQLLVGSTGAAPAAATLTAGTGITITNAAHSITINASAEGTAWSDKAVSFDAADSSGYIITASAVVATLPASPSVGATVNFIVDTTGAALTITANTGQFIRFGAVKSVSAGTAVNSAQGDSVKLVYSDTTTSWIAESAPQGVWNIT